MSYEFLLPSIVILISTIAIPFLFHLSKYLGDKNTASKHIDDVYESGIRPYIKDSFERFHIKYYLVAIIFVLFDVEIIFMFPWAVNLRDLGMFGLLEMLTFMFLLLVGLIFIYKKGALKWI